MASLLESISRTWDFNIENSRGCRWNARCLSAIGLNKSKETDRYAWIEKSCTVAAQGVRWIIVNKEKNRLNELGAWLMNWSLVTAWPQWVNLTRTFDFQRCFGHCCYHAEKWARVKLTQCVFEPVKCENGFLDIRHTSLQTRTSSIRIFHDSLLHSLQLFLTVLFFLIN